MDNRPKLYPTPQQSFDGPGARSIIDQSGPSSLPIFDKSEDLTQITSPPLSSSSSNYRPQNMQPKPEPGSTSPDERPGTSTSASNVSGAKRVGGKANVSAACAPCKKAHLACDVARPCKRCVNMGKEDQCEDVPHKKRGRPKVPKPAIGEPYQRNYRPGTTDPMPVPGGRWRGLSTSEGSYPGSGDYSHLHPNATPYPMPFMGHPGRPPSPGKPELFELFTSIDFRIYRATPPCSLLTGFHPQEYVNISLGDYVHPAERHLLDTERSRLISSAVPSGGLQTHRDAQAAITQLSERELLTPAEGMREPYPNQNVRILRSDNGYDWYNVRLHLGGGLGASLWRGETLGKLYLVVSLLLLQQPPPDFASQNGDLSRRPIAPIVPPTPVTPAQPGGLPSFSSFAAAAEASRGTMSQYLPPPAGPSSLSVPIPPPTQPQSYFPSYYRPAPILPGLTQPHMPPRQSSSPGSNRMQIKAEPEYQHHPSSYPPVYRPDERGMYVRPSGGSMQEEDWRNRQAQNWNTNPTPTPHTASQPQNQMPDYTRRAWEL